MTNSLIEGGALTLADLCALETERPTYRLSEPARIRMEETASTVCRLAGTDHPYYGLNTGFGALANRHIGKRQIELQYNLARSHTTGTGSPLAPALVRRILLLKANSLAVGISGVRSIVVDHLLAFLNHDVLPVIPERGSVGASGDLAPLAHLVLALIGEGEARVGGLEMQGIRVPQAAGVPALVLEAKEALALLNGTQVSTALAVDGLLRGRRLLQASIAIGALTTEALCGSHQPFDPRIHEARGQPGQIRVARRFSRLLPDTEIQQSHRDCPRVQDPYSVRCQPQVLGMVEDTLSHAAGILTHEINGVTDNPLVFGEDIVSGGNFHAEPVGAVADFMAIALAEIGALSERRIDLLMREVNPRLPPFLARDPGVESGFMIAHVSAAALASENKTLAHPATVDSLPTSAGQEDHVSMAPWAGYKLRSIADNVETILAIELLAASAGVDFLRPLRSSPPLEELHARVREKIPPHLGDRRLDHDIHALGALLGDPGLWDKLVPEEPT
ncbi:Histidine ammonia-lyase [mine drainage metagenome]|uniref:histidine ammonia-lyase n=3 Tax=mine drainage metagenome TaxID=410659 RepID=T1BCS4_9ZZZZ